MEQQNSAREKILKKVRNALIEASDNPYTQVDFEAAIFETPEALDIQFAEVFNSNGGHFVYCENPKDFSAQISALCKEKEWDKVLIQDPDLKVLFDKTGFDQFELKETLSAN